MSLNIVPCFAIKQLQYTCYKGILSIQIMGKCIFVLFRNLFHFKSRAKLVIFFKFCFTKQLRYAPYDLETRCSHLGSIKHTYISLVKLFPYRSQCNFFPVFILFSWAQHKILNNDNNNNSNNNNNNSNNSNNNSNNNNNNK